MPHVVSYLVKPKPRVAVKVVWSFLDAEDAEERYTIIKRRKSCTTPAILLDPNIPPIPKRKKKKKRKK